MKVICIDAKSKVDINRHLLKEGGYYNTIYDGDCYCVRTNSISPGYALAEFGMAIGFDKSRFIPLSDVDEKEFERNYNKELV